MDGVMDGWMVSHSMDSPNAQDSLSCAFGEFNYLILLMFLQPESSARTQVSLHVSAITEVCLRHS